MRSNTPSGHCSGTNNENRLLAVAAGVVFYGLLAVFPALTAFVSLYGLMADPSTIHERLSLATGILPQGALNILNEQLTRLTSHGTSARQGQRCLRRN
jgi:membrane protein